MAAHPAPAPHVRRPPNVMTIERRTFGTPWSLAMFVLEVSKPSGIHLAALVDDRIRGYVICSRYDTVWHVMNVAVDPDARRMGVATALLEGLLERIDDPEPRLTLEVRQSNAPAIALYEGLGFRSRRASGAATTRTTARTPSSCGAPRRPSRAAWTTSRTPAPSRSARDPRDRDELRRHVRGGRDARRRGALERRLLPGRPRPLRRRRARGRLPPPPRARQRSRRRRAAPCRRDARRRRARRRHERARARRRAARRRRDREGARRRARAAARARRPPAGPRRRELPAPRGRPAGAAVPLPHRLRRSHAARPGGRPRPLHGPRQHARRRRGRGDRQGRAAARAAVPGRPGAAAPRPGGRPAGVRVPDGAAASPAWTCPSRASRRRCSTRCATWARRRRGAAAADLAASYQHAIVEALVDRCVRALRETGLRRLALGGGVAANGPLRAQGARAGRGGLRSRRWSCAPTTRR